MKIHKLLLNLIYAGGIGIAFGCATTNDKSIPQQGSTTSNILRHDLLSPVFLESKPEVNFEHLSDYLQYAALNNPELKAAFSRWKAALERIPQAKSLEDPKFNYGYFIQEVETRVGPQNQRMGLSQAFPWFGTLSLREGKAADEARMAQEQYEAVKVRLFFRVKDAYYEYYYLRRAIDITLENIDLLKSLESVAQTKVRTGNDTGGVVKAQVEIGKLEDRLISFQDLRKPVVAKLNTTLGLPSDNELPRPVEIYNRDLDLDKDAVFRMLGSTNPELQALEHQIKANEKSVDLARKKFYPNITLGMDYVLTGNASNPAVFDSGKDPVMAMFAINIPLWNSKNRAGLREAQGKRDASMYALEDSENQLESELEMAWFAFQDAERKRNLYKNTLTPLAENSLNVARESYEAGRSNFLEWIDAQRLLLEFQLSYERALADKEQNLARIEQIIGRQINHLSIEQKEESP